MNLPNKLTVLRIAIVPFYVFFLLMPSVPHHFLIAFLLFGVAAYTDHLDGTIARKRNMITDFGKFADPLADKIMVISALGCFVELGLTSSIILILIIAREFMVTSLRLVAVEKGKVVAANSWGKAKTVSQIVAILLILAMQYVLELHTIGCITIFNIETVTLVFNIAGIVLMGIVVLFTWISGAIYIWNNREFIKNAK